MSASYDLFCRWKHVQKIQSDNAGAIALGVSRATVSIWKQGKNAEINYIEKMAVEIGDSPEVWSAVVMAERSNSDAEKAAWKRIAQKLAAVAMALALGIGFTLPRDVQAAVGHSATDAVYIMRNNISGESRSASRVPPSFACKLSECSPPPRIHV
jgi:hypothetical protein